MPRTTTVHAVTTIGMDMGKNTLHMIGLDLRGAIVLREKVSRGRITSRLANVPSCLIGIEAGMATHYVARELAALGQDVGQRLAEEAQSLPDDDAALQEKAANLIDHSSPFADQTRPHPVQRLQI